jgi:hypothetical protein
MQLAYTDDNWSSSLSQKVKMKILWYSDQFKSIQQNQIYRVTRPEAMEKNAFFSFPFLHFHSPDHYLPSQVFNLTNIKMLPSKKERSINSKRRKKRGEGVELGTRTKTKLLKSTAQTLILPKSGIVVLIITYQICITSPRKDQFKCLAWWTLINGIYNINN